MVNTIRFRFDLIRFLCLRLMFVEITDGLGNSCAQMKRSKHPCSRCSNNTVFSSVEMQNYLWVWEYNYLWVQWKVEQGTHDLYPMFNPVLNEGTVQNSINFRFPVRVSNPKYWAILLWIYYFTLFTMERSVNIHCSVFKQFSRKWEDNWDVQLFVGQDCSL